MSSFEVHHSHRRYQDVSRHEEEFLLVRYEAGYWLMCKAVLEFPTGKGRTPKAKWVASAIRYSSMEVGFYFYGFYRWVANI